MACGEADTIVFDKTGTLTEVKPMVADVAEQKGLEYYEMQGRKCQ